LALSVYEWFEGIDPAEYTALERLRGKTDNEKRRRGAWTVSQNICDEKTIVILV
jgi:hypothetical protein